MISICFLVFFSGIKDVRSRERDETVNTLQLAVSVCLASFYFPESSPAYCYPTAFFFLSAYAIVTKALCKKAILIFVCFYFMVITIIIIVLLFLLCFIFPQCIQLNANKPICKLAKQKEKLEYLVSGLKMEELPFHLDINTSRLYSHHTC